MCLAHTRSLQRPDGNDILQHSPVFCAITSERTSIEEIMIFLMCLLSILSVIWTGSVRVGADNLASAEINAVISIPIKGP